MSNVKLNLNQRAYGSIETAIGRLFVFAMTGGDVIELERELGGDWSKVVPDVLIRAFILHTCFLETQLVDENTKPKGVKIEYELIEKLTKADLDNRLITGKRTFELKEVDMPAFLNLAKEHRKESRHVHESIVSRLWDPGLPVRTYRVSRGQGDLRLEP